MMRALKFTAVGALAFGILAGLAIWFFDSAEAPTEPVKLDVLLLEPESRLAETSAAPVKQSDPRVDDSQFSNWANAVKAELIRRDEGESLIVAVLLTLSNYAPEMGSDADTFRRQVELLKRASAHAPSNAAVQWLAWLTCTAIVDRKFSCDADMFAKALRSADPKNAMPLFGAIKRARDLKDERAEAEAVAAVEASGGFSSYFAVIEPLLFNTIESVRLAQPPSRAQDNGYTPLEALTMGVLASLPVPTFRPLIDSCTRIGTDPLAARCLAIAKQMRNSDNYLSRSVGLSIAERLTPFGSSTFGALSDERRTLRWMQEQIAKPWIPPEAMRRLLPSAGGEIEMWQAWLRENGIPTVPPVDWEGK